MSSDTGKPKCTCPKPIWFPGPPGTPPSHGMFGCQHVDPGCPVHGKAFYGDISEEDAEQIR